MLPIFVEYLVAARKTGPGGAGAGQPPCVTGGGGAPACGHDGRTRRPGCLVGAGGLTGVGGRGRGRRRARRREGVGEGGRGGQPCCSTRRMETARARGPRRRLYPTPPRHRSWRCSAAPRSVARQSLATSAVSASGRHHVSPMPRHHAWRGTGIWPRQGNRRGQKC